MFSNVMRNGAELLRFKVYHTNCGGARQDTSRDLPRLGGWAPLEYNWYPL